MTRLPVLGCLLTLTFLISGCASDPYYAQMSTVNHYNTPRNLAGYIYNIGKYDAFTVPKEGRQKHEQCVFFALDNLNIGENCEWATRHAFGNVQVMSHRLVGSGFCTTLLSSTKYRGKSKAWRETACTNGTNNNWKFIDS